ncbi:unnamed protein product [Alternaria alternata]
MSATTPRFRNAKTASAVLRSHKMCKTWNFTPRFRFPERAIEYVGFDVERKAFGGAYLSARYESLREDTDFTVQRYLTGIVTMNPGEEELKAKSVDEDDMKRVMRDLELERFIDKPVSMLSNGQSRRARIAKALLRRPEMLCLDAPFIGLDPIVTKHISKVLHRLAEANAPRVVLSLRPQDDVPDWITHVVYAGEDGKVNRLGPKEEVLRYLEEKYGEIDSLKDDEQSSSIKDTAKAGQQSGRDDSKTSPGTPALSRDGYERVDTSIPTIGEPVVEMQGVRIAYGQNSVLERLENRKSMARGQSMELKPSEDGPKPVKWQVNTKYLDAYENGFVYPSQARDRRDLVDLMGLLNWMPDVGMKSGRRAVDLLSTHY